MRKVLLFVVAMIGIVANVMATSDVELRNFSTSTITSAGKASPFYDNAVLPDTQYKYNQTVENYGTYVTYVEPEPEPETFATKVTKADFNTGALLKECYVFLKTVGKNHGNADDPKTPYFNGAEAKTDTLGYGNVYQLGYESGYTTIKNVKSGNYIANNSVATGEITVAASEGDRGFFTLSLQTNNTDATAFVDGTVLEDLIRVMDITNNSYFNAQDDNVSAKYATGMGNWSVWEVYTLTEDEVAELKAKEPAPVPATQYRVTYIVRGNSESAGDSYAVTTADGTAIASGDKLDENTGVKVSATAGTDREVKVMLGENEVTLTEGAYEFTLTQDTTLNITFSAVEPEPTPTTHKYYIQDKNSMLYVAFDESYTSSAETNVKNALYTSNDPYEFTATFDADNNTYVFVHEVNGTEWSIGQSSTSWNFTNTGNTAWTVEDAGDGLVYFKGANGYWKGDATKAGSYFYCDGAKSAARKFMLIDAEKTFVNTAALESALLEASYRVVGETAFINYTGIESTAWENIQKAAQAVLNDENHTQEQVDAQATTLTNALSQLTVVEPYEDLMYNLKLESTGTYMNLTSEGATMSETPTDVYFTKVDGDTPSWYINAEEDVYVGYSNGNFVVNSGRISVVPVACAANKVAFQQTSSTTYDCLGWKSNASDPDNYWMRWDCHPVEENAQWTVIQTETPVPTAISQLSANGSQLKNGKFIQNGRVVIVKNGKKFNANGQMIR